VSDPAAWTPAELPETWADRLSILTPHGFWTYCTGPFRSLLRLPRPVMLPPNLPGRLLPSYLLQEFHGMPNGYYSTAVSLAYARGFEIVMLQRMTGLRERMADALHGCTSVLDVGCGAGRLAESLRQRGASDVWGLDPCPYALTVAAARVPGVRFTQGLAEDTGFAPGRFDGVGVCFVLHELPRAALEKALGEFRRVLRPGGTLVLAEPSPVHVRGSWWSVLRKYGLTGGYYKALARLVFEPFLEDWLGLDLHASLEGAGFRVERDVSNVPFRELVATSL
jgi:ubiquinone/menaquinone biosynthesis C-methylase UbiE